MTREDAIEVLNGIEEVHGTLPEDGNKIDEALSMAIKALEQEPCEDAVSRILKRMWNCRGKHTTSIDKVKMEQIICDELPPVRPQEPCEDAISRQDAIDAMYKMHMNGKKGVESDLENLYGSAKCFSETISDAVEVLEDMPSVAIPSVEPKEGHWEWLTEDKYRCSNCNHETRVDECMNEPMYDFCPFCGAKMVEPQESEG